MAHTWRRFTLLAVAVIVAGLLAACGGKPESTGSVTAVASVSGGDGPVVEVRIKNFKYEPAEITVAPGTRVVFINEDPTPHNVVAGTVQDVTKKAHKPIFESPEIPAGGRWEYVFDTEGEFPYVCTIAGHYLMGMTGTVKVSSAVEKTAAVETLAENVAVEAAPEAITATATQPSQSVGVHSHTHGTARPDALDPERYTPTPDGLADLKPFRVEGNVKEFLIDIVEIEHELIDGVVVTAWAFNGMMPGPTLRVQEGDLVRVHFTNTHHQPHTIHWHGIYADQIHDGVPHTSAAVMPGETRTYEFVADEAGTFWYHCHVDSYRHVDLGMYGAIVVEPASGRTWDREYTLILDDWDSEIDPLSPTYRPNHNYFLVNGKAFPDIPTLTLPIGETTRVRLINAGYSNVAMHLHGPSFTVVASDGRPLPVPYTKDTLDVAPGERYDIEIRPTKAGVYPFHAHNLQFVLNNGHYPGGMHLMVEIVEPEEM